MFTPDFGMFIAPGCNGIRGAVTMGLIALVAGYLYRFRWRAHAMVVLAAVLLGYVFNFVRLCVLVLFYLVALHFPWLQDRAENADYLIGAALFFVAVYLLYIVIHRLGSSRDGEPTGVLLLPRTAPEAPIPGPGFYLRTAALAGLVAIGMFSVVRGMMAPGPSAELKADETALGQFPETIGAYTLVRRWNENLLTGALLFHWAEYAPTAVAGGTHIAITPPAAKTPSGTASRSSRPPTRPSTSAHPSTTTARPNTSKPPHCATEPVAASTPVRALTSGSSTANRTPRRSSARTRSAPSPSCSKPKLSTPPCRPMSPAGNSAPM
jgi:exosortase J